MKIVLFQDCKTSQQLLKKNVVVNINTTSIYVVIMSNKLTVSFRYIQQHILN